VLAQNFIDFASSFKNGNTNDAFWDLFENVGGGHNLSQVMLRVMVASFVGNFDVSVSTFFFCPAVFAVYSEVFLVFASYWYTIFCQLEFFGHVIESDLN
jgi:hypothetical protein